VYGAVIMAKAITRVHPVHLVSADSASGGRQPSDQVNRLGLLVRRYAATMIPSTSPSPFIIITQPESWYSFYRPMEVGRLSLPSRLPNFFYNFRLSVAK